ncbi:hypothetical protein POTOM_025712 [Populus tomentosa]|uniref:Uncharacterized protein n=1 Tax=Populus tomentosa TaxID=118781 RepID=A0A8X8CXF9_POPTO|nr:hypothetical protein POTOM_025712 [Populus tomentosa]
MGNRFARSLVGGDEVVLWSCLWSVEGARVGSVGCGQKLPLLVKDMMEEIWKWGGDLKWGAGLGGLCGEGMAERGRFVGMGFESERGGVVGLCE